MDDLEILIKYFEGRNYGDLIMPLFGLLAIIIGYRYVRSQRTGIFFLLYISFDFLMSICDTYVQAFSPLNEAEAELFVNITNSLISVVELLVYFYFFSKILHKRAIRRLMNVSATIFVFVVALGIATKYSFLTTRVSYIANVIGTIEFIFLIPPCFVYFYELFQHDPAIDLHVRPSFWIVTGILFYAVVSIPYYLINRFFAENQRDAWSFTFLVFYSLPFTVNFVFLTRAFLCKKTLTI